VVTHAIQAVAPSLGIDLTPLDRNVRFWP